MRRIISFESPFSRLFRSITTRPTLESCHPQHRRLAGGLAVLGVGLIFAGLGCSDDDDCSVCPNDCVDRVIITSKVHDLTSIHYLIDSVRVEGRRIYIDTTVGGGCDEHFYRLFVGDAFEESEPVQTWAYLVHESDDPCDAILHHNLEFDLQPLIELYQMYYGGIGRIKIKVYPNNERTGDHYMVQFNP